jgi:hypothetical protein
VQQILWADVSNVCQRLGVLIPEQWPVVLWTVLSWLDSDGLLGDGCAPLSALYEPLRCYGGLDATGRPRPEGEKSDIACQCYIPYDPDLPPGIGQHVVGHDPAANEAFLARARLQPRSEPPVLTDLEPLYRFARRLRSGRSGVEIHPEELSFVGVVLADVRTPELWLYRHEVTIRRARHPLALDAAGHAWWPRADRRFRCGYRWVAAPDTTAVLRAAPPTRTTDGERW